MFKNFYFDSIIGKNHNENQDSIDCFVMNDIFFACVCDGIGSVNGSKIASKTFINSLRKHSVKIDKNKISEQNLRKWFDSLLDIVNNEYYEIIKNNSQYSKMSTTACLYLIYKNEVFWFNIGDSRIYYYSYKENKVNLITKDHNLRNYFLNNNIKNIQPKYIPYLDSLVNSISLRMKNKLQNYDCGKFIIQKKDIIVISSDGAYKFCDFNKINFKNLSSSKKIVNNIIELSIYNNSFDDISVGVIIC